eukprot:jgi/Tetstr1/423282/TSEL_013981.t1
MKTPVWVPYNSAYVVDTWDGIRAANSFRTSGDHLDSHDYITLLYTRYRILCGERGQEIKAGWNREHVWPRSIGNLSTEQPGAGTDLHNLFPTDCSVNCARGSSNFHNIRRCRGARPFLDTTPAPGYNGLLDAYKMGNAWEPPDAAKGQVARALFYMACQYCDCGDGNRMPLRLTEHDDGLHCSRGDGGPGYLGKLSTLLEWNRRFPPQDAEKKRNSTVERIQGNRNPFIDLPGLADMVTWETSAPHPGVLSLSLLETLPE